MAVESRMWTWSLAQLLGASEAGVRLLVGQLMGYPLCALYRCLFFRAGDTVQHLFFSATGLGLAWFSVGEDAVVHAVVTCTANFVLARLWGGTGRAAVAAVALNLGYLLAGYTLADGGSPDADYSWTMPQCVLCLKMIGLAFDMWDNNRNEDELSIDMKLSRLEHPPTFLETLSFGVFMGNYLFGPQMSLRKYKDFIILNQTYETLPSPVPYALQRCVLGLTYIWLRSCGQSFLGEYMAHPELMMGEGGENVGFALRTLRLWVWFKVHMSLYMGIFLVAEGVCVMAGAGYNGVDPKTGRVQWDAMANVNVYKFECGVTSFNDIISSFNMKTNKWMANYVYKRFKFLNSKPISQGITLAFLGVWHGFHSGYYLIFLNEFLVTSLENDLFTTFQDIGLSDWVRSRPLVRRIAYGLGWIHINAVVPYCFYPFPLMTYERWFPVMKASRFFLYYYIAGGFSVLETFKMVRMTHSHSPS